MDLIQQATKHNNIFNSSSIYNNNQGLMTNMNTPMCRAIELLTSHLYKFIPICCQKLIRMQLIAYICSLEDEVIQVQ